VSAGDSRTQLDGHEALLGDPHQRHRLGDPGQDPVADHASFIQHHLQFDTTRLQQRSNLTRATHSADFLVMAVCEIHGSHWPEPFDEEHLHGFERALDRGLVVDCTPPPDESIDDSAAEGILLPFLPCARLDC
jgi:hypothetical protein